MCPRVAALVATTCRCIGPANEIQANVPIDMYFVLAHPQVEKLGGVEFGWAFSPAVAPAPVVLGLTLPPNSLNIGTAYNLIVGFGSGLMTSDATLLVSLRLMFTQAPMHQTWITVGPAVPATIPGRMAFNDFHNPADLYPMDFIFVATWHPHLDSAGWVQPGIGWLENFCFPIEVEGTTWSQVKAVFE